MPDSPLHGRTVVVTGAARGVGAALAREIARCGGRLALLGHERSRLAEIAARLPSPALAIGVDVTDLEALRTAAGEVRRRLGRPSVVVANAGIAQGGPFASSDPVEWRRVIDVNLTGSAQTARVFLPDLIATAGYHLQIASLASLGAAPLMSAYCASKAGVEAFAHALRAEVAHQGVGVGIAYLNWTDTDMIRDADRYNVLRELRGHMPPPARRVHPVDAVAARIVRGLERRRTAVYAPAWLRLVQPVRAALPPVVLRVARYELPRLQAEEPFVATGLLGAGGAADRSATGYRP
ncbi:SDR family oxidoreductase [Streptomyces collinus]|uniref:Short chain dehydrogenase n=1 Tax=Streptomyces collinus (strain DSM 40733 / Tue 365) TaxID=1214242 RepID=S5UNZ9_STRC3|nr:SDR family oxidoreductase [Streptomyces collinus]AGS67506.1 short chain dehydrogenase [Streptomyces collinus Tu 365]UJA06186.1 SDR family oxidoreductase [Streptomyces collinus]UJA12644.1 SDR family oxidoreductase [Streptomyces collinus]